MLNVDQKKEGEEISDDEHGNINGKLSNVVEKKLILPNLHSRQPSTIKDPMNLSVELNCIDEINGDGNGNGNLNNIKEVEKNSRGPKM